MVAFVAGMWYDRKKELEGQHELLGYDIIVGHHPFAVFIRRNEDTVGKKEKPTLYHRLENSDFPISGHNGSGFGAAVPDTIRFGNTGNFLWHHPGDYLLGDSKKTPPTMTFTTQEGSRQCTNY